MRQRGWVRGPVAGVLGALALGAGCISVDLESLLRHELREVTLTKAAGWDANQKVLVFDLSGVIMNRGAGGGWGDSAMCSPDYVKAVLNKARADENVKAVVLRINSPGGEVTASDIIGREIKQFAAQTGRPVYAMILGTGCSGAYYAACGADRIYAHPSSIIGSIGVIASFPQIVKLADKVGVEQVVIKSGALKDMGSMLRPMSDEERGVMQGLVDDFYNQFLDWVAAARPALKSRETLKPLADGRVYTASQSLKNGLVDRLATLDEVVADARKAAGLKDASVVVYSYAESADANLYSPVSQASLPRLSVVDLGASLPVPLRQSGFFYLWQPGW